MQPVEHRPPWPGNPGASRSAQPRHGVGASAGIVRHGPDGRGRISDSGWWSCAGRPLGPGARTLDRNSGYLGRSDCTAPPACGSARTGTAGPVGPCALRRHRRCWTDASQRAKLRWHRLHRHGVGRGTVYKLASKWDRAASTFFGVSVVVSPGRQVRPLPIGEHPPNDPSPIQCRTRRGQVNLRNRRLTVEYARFLTVVHTSQGPFPPERPRQRRRAWDGVLQESGQLESRQTRNNRNPRMVKRRNSAYVPHDRTAKLHTPVDCTPTMTRSQKTPANNVREKPTLWRPDQPHGSVSAYSMSIWSGLPFPREGGDLTPLPRADVN